MIRQARDQEDSHYYVVVLGTARHRYEEVSQAVSQVSQAWKAKEKLSILGSGPILISLIVEVEEVLF